MQLKIPIVLGESSIAVRIQRWMAEDEVPQRKVFQFELVFIYRSSTAAVCPSGNFK